MRLYNDVLKTGRKFTLQRPQIWVFGLFTYFVFGLGGEVERYVQTIVGTLSKSSIVNPAFWVDYDVAMLIAQMKTSLLQGDGSVWVFLLMILVSSAVVLYMVSLSQAAISYGVAHPRIKRFSALFAHGAAHAPTIVVLTISTGLTIVVSTLVLGAVMVTLLEGYSTPTQSFWAVASAIVLLAPLIVGGRNCA